MKYILAAVAAAIFIALMIATIYKQKEAERKEKEYEERMRKGFQYQRPIKAQIEMKVDTTQTFDAMEQMRKALIQKVDYVITYNLSYNISNGLQVWLNI